MSFMSMWGFGPKEAFNAQRAFLERIDGHECAYSLGKKNPRRSHRMFTLKLSSCSEDTAAEMGPDALKDEPSWGRLAEIVREIAPSDEELDTIRKRLAVQLDRVQRTDCPQGGFGSSDH